MSGDASIAVTAAPSRAIGSRTNMTVFNRLVSTAPTDRPGLAVPNWDRSFVTLSKTFAIFPSLSTR